MSHILNILDESKWGKLLYHSTPRNYDPKDIGPGSHFGTTPEASTKRSRDLMDLHGAKGSSKFKVHACSYKPSGKTVNIRDNPHSDNDWERYTALDLSQMGHITKQDSTKIAYEPESFHSVLRSRGISTLTYRPAEDPKHDAHVVLDPENLEHVHTFHNPKSLHR